jgi:AcrR family transcriptional regulator
VKRKERAAETEAALKAAAKRLFATRGYLNTKITDITAEAGRAAGSFYNHFGSKEELLEGLLADLSAASDEQAAEPGHNPDFSDPDAVRWHVRAYWRFLQEHAATMRALRQAALVNEDFATKLARFGTDEMADVRGHLAQITDAGFRLPAEPGATLAMMYALVENFVELWQDTMRELSEEDAIEAVTRFAYRGLTGQDY